MVRAPILAACLALGAVVSFFAGAQSITVYQTTPDLLEALSQRENLHFTAKSGPAAVLPIIGVDDGQQFQAIDGFGASLTDAAAWLLARKLTPALTDSTLKMLFSRKGGIALGFLRQPVGSSDLAVTFYSFDDLCEQGAKPCTTPAGMSRPQAGALLAQARPGVHPAAAHQGAGSQSRDQGNADAVEPAGVDEDFRLDAGVEP